MYGGPFFVRSMTVGGFDCCELALNQIWHRGQCAGTLARFRSGARMFSVAATAGQAAI